MRRALSRAATAFVVLAWVCAWAGAARADQQRDPELKTLLQKIIGSSDCFADKFESEVWYKTMEPRLVRLVPTHEARVEILDHVYCEAKRDPSLQLPPDLVLALIEVESRFDRWAVSPAGAVGLMQVMPFWPRQLGVQNQLVQVAPNIRMGCEILRYYLRVENRNWSRALARYNGSVGRNTYPALVMQRWQRAWRF
jgi:soluble lytic murein transglycosylase-like protein